MTAPVSDTFEAFRERVHGDPAVQARLAEPGEPEAFAAAVAAEAAALGLAVAAGALEDALRRGHLAWLTSRCEVV